MLTRLGLWFRENDSEARRPSKAQTSDHIDRWDPNSDSAVAEIDACKLTPDMGRSPRYFSKVDPCSAGESEGSVSNE